MSNVVEINRKAEQAWTAYVDAARSAQATGRLADGIEAGRRWRAFLDQFITAEQRGTMERQGPACS